MDTNGDLFCQLEPVGFGDINYWIRVEQDETNFVSKEEPLQGILGPSAHYLYILSGPNYVFSGPF